MNDPHDCRAATLPPRGMTPEAAREWMRGRTDAELNAAVGALRDEIGIPGGIRHGGGRDCRCAMLTSAHDDTANQQSQTRSAAHRDV